MAAVKKGFLVRSSQWWVHLKEYKKVFWKQQRKAEKKDIKERLTNE